MTRISTRAVVSAAACAAALMAPGCISLLPQTEPDALYRLDVVDVPEAALDTRGETVVIGRIAAPRGLAGDRIAIQRDGRIAYMAGVAWLSPAPSMLHGAVLDTLHAEAGAITPARPEDGVAARYALDLELRSFEAIYDAGEGRAPLVQVALRARMIDRDTRALVGTRSLQASQRAAANRQSAIVDAFSAATGDLASALADWVEGVVCDSEGAPQACGA